MARIDEASQRPEVLTKDLLALARLEARGARLQRSMLNLVEVIDAAKDTYLSQAENKGVTIEFLAESVRIRGDRHWLIRAVGNLIANALRYSPSHSRIIITLTTELDTAVIRVKDHGPGIEPGLRGRIFDRFVTDRNTPDQTGIGLAIVLSIAEIHGGSVRVIETSEPGACLELRLALP